MKNHLMILLLAVLFFGCENETLPEPMDDLCTPNNTPADPQPFLHDGHLIEDNYVYRVDTMCSSSRLSCNTLKEIPDTFYLIDNARKYLPQSALNVGDNIFYVNEAGEFMRFEIVLKDHAVSKSYYTLPCDTLTGYCFNTERYQLDMFSQDCKYQLIITVSATVRGEEGNWFQRDGMSVKDYTYGFGDRSLFYFPLYEPSVKDAQYHPQITIHGQPYEDVYSMNLYSKMEVFYHTEYGLLSFIDENGVEWKLYH